MSILLQLCLALCLAMELKGDQQAKQKQTLGKKIFYQKRAKKGNIDRENKQKNRKQTNKN